MTAYVKKSGKNFGSSGSKPGFGGDRGHKKSFGKKSFGDSRSSDRPATFYKATCTKCGKPCEVPFRPVSGKPVFCRDCFVRTGDTGALGRAGDKYPKREFQPRGYASPASESSSGADVMKKLEEINSKLDRLIRATESAASRVSKER